MVVCHLAELTSPASNPNPRRHEAEHDSRREQLGGLTFGMESIVERPATTLGEMIVRTPGVLGGKPCLQGHRVGVHRVAGWWKLGLSVEEIGERLSTLTPAEIHAALAYYHLNREEIESYLEEERIVTRDLASLGLNPTSS